MGGRDRRADRRARYHVIDQWQLYKDAPLKIVLPPDSGLGAYGGIIAAYLYARRKGQPFLRWADAGAPGLFAMQTGRPLGELL